jgi:hypothetical protein
MGAKTSVLTIAVAVIALTLASAASALTPSQIGKCTDLSGKSALNTKHVLDGLPLDPAVVREVRSRLVQYDSVRGFPGLDGIEGLTPELQAEIMRRVAVADKARTWGIGNPCPKFKNRAKVVAEVKKLLIYNGYRPAMKVTYPSPRQIVVDAIQDGYRYLVVVVKIAPRKLFVVSNPIPTSAGGGGSVTVPLKFDA